MTTQSVQSDSSARTPTSHSTDEDSHVSSSTSTDSVPLGDNEYSEEEKRNGTCRIAESDTDSDKDLVITSLTESLQIHKEILERLHNEKQEFIANIEKERQSEREATEKEKKQAQQALEEQMERYQRLEKAYTTVVKELEAKKEEFKRMEAKFYAHVRSIRPTDDDLSTIQYEINHLSGQLNNFCMGLKSKMDRSGGTAYILERWSDREDAIKQHLYKPDSEDERLESGVITMFTEKLITEILTKNIFNQPIHAGVSVNDTFKSLSDWMEPRNAEWAGRLRQQVSALVVKQPGIEQDSIDNAIKQVVTEILDELSNIYPRVKDGEVQKKKVENIVAKAAKLNLAMKGQDIKVFCAPIEEGVATFDERLMKPVSRSKPDGTVLFVISPPFVAVDPKDEDHGFIIHAKVFCA